MGHCSQRDARGACAPEHAAHAHPSRWFVTRRNPGPSPSHCSTGGLARLIGRNEVAFERWSWGLHSTSVPCQSQNGGCTPGLIMLAVGELADDRVLYGYARDGSSNSRERGCGCMQTTKRTKKEKTGLARFWRRAGRFWITPRGRPHRGVEWCVSHVHAEIRSSGRGGVSKEERPR